MSEDDRKTKAELIAELDDLRARIEVSDTDQARLALRESEERYRIVTEISRDAVEVVNEAGEYIFVNPVVEEIFGFPPQEILGRKFRDFLNIVHPDDRDSVSTKFESIEKRGETVHFPPMRCRHKDGSWIWINSIATSYLSASGERCMLEVTRDITEQVEEEQRRRRLGKQMQEAQRLESLGVLAGGIAHQPDARLLGAKTVGDRTS